MIGLYCDICGLKTENLKLVLHRLICLWCLLDKQNESQRSIAAPKGQGSK